MQFYEINMQRQKSASTKSALKTNGSTRSIQILNFAQLHSKLFATLFALHMCSVDVQCLHMRTSCYTCLLPLSIITIKIGYFKQCIRIIIITLWTYQSLPLSRLSFFGRLTPGVGTKAFCLDQYIIMNTLGPNKQHNTASALNCIVDDTTAVCIVDLSVAM